MKPHPRRTLRTIAGRWFTRHKDRIWTGLRAGSAVRDPAACLRVLFPEMPKDAYATYYREIEDAHVLRESIERHLPHTKPWRTKLDSVAQVIIVLGYAAVRWMKPRVIVETGCATGWSSALLLYALHKNQAGHLYTIDLPSRDGKLGMTWSIPAHLKTGYLVPDELRARWTLIEGDVRDHLLPLLREVGTVDYFWHDSDHSYTHMMWEYTTVWNHLRIGGVLASDDIWCNTAFWDFAAALNVPTAIYARNPGFGALAKIPPKPGKP